MRQPGTEKPGQMSILLAKFFRISHILTIFWKSRSPDVRQELLSWITPTLGGLWIGLSPLPDSPREYEDVWKCKIQLIIAFATSLSS